MAKKSTARKPSPCDCLALCNEKLRDEKGCELETDFSIDFSTGKVSESGPYLKVRRVDAKSRKKLPTIACTYCPICGKKKA